MIYRVGCNVVLVIKWHQWTRNWAYKEGGDVLFHARIAFFRFIYDDRSVRDSFDRLCFTLKREDSFQCHTYIYPPAFGLLSCTDVSCRVLLGLDLEHVISNIDFTLAVGK